MYLYDRKRVKCMNEENNTNSVPTPENVEITPVGSANPTVTPTQVDNIGTTSVVNEAPIGNDSPVGDISTNISGVVNQEVSPTPVESEPITLTPGEPSNGGVEIQNMTTNNTVPEPVQTDLNQIPPVAGTAIQNPVSGDTNPQPEKKKGIKKPIIIIGILVVLALVGYFVVYPMIKGAYMSSPKNVFESTIKTMRTNVGKVLNQVNVGTSSTEITFNVDSNVDGISDFKDYTFSFSGGIDAQNKKMEAKASMVDKNKKEIGGTAYVKNDYLYYKLSGDERLVKSVNLAEQEGYSEMFDIVENANTSDYIYLIENVTNSIIANFKEEDFVKEDSAFTVNGTEVKVVKNSYVINKERMITHVKAIFNGLYEDSKAMEIIEKLGMSKDEFKKEMDSIADDDFDDDLKVTINIYTNKKNDVVGFDLYGNDEGKDVELLYFYYNEGNFEGKILDDGSDDNISITGVKDGEVTNASIKYTDEEIATLKITKLEENAIDFSYVIKSDSESISGDISLSTETSNSSSKLRFTGSAKNGDEFIKINLNMNTTYNAKIAEFDESKAVELSEEEQNAIMETFVSSLEDTPFAYVNDSLGGYDAPVVYDYDKDSSYDISDNATPEEGNSF